MDEKTFWRTMNPARLHALFNAYFRPEQKRTGNRQIVEEAGNHTKFVDFDHPQISEKGLADYFNGR